MANEEANEKKRGLQIKQILKNLKEGAKESVRITPEDRRQNLRWIREHEKKAEAPRAHFTFAQQPIIDLLRQAKTAGNPIASAIPGVQELDDYNLLVRGNSGLNIGGVTEFDLSDEDPVKIKSQADAYKKQLKKIPLDKKLGYLGGSAVNDLINDTSRSVWWLINAPQAVGNITHELSVNQANPEFFASEEITDLDEAVNKGVLRYRPQVEPSPDFGARPGSVDYEKEMRSNPQNYIPGSTGISYDKGRNAFTRRKYNPNLINVATMLPSALAINAGIGLLGRQDGYAMTVPDEDDPRKTGNVIAEVASKFLLGREGRLLEAEDALLERPDLSYGDYQRYKNYLRDREIDLNIFDDGKINLGGVLKTNNEGIRGPEINFMGKALPVADTITPAVSSILGSVLAARATRKLGMSKAANVATLFGGGMAGLAAGNLVGNTIENERRRRNFEERNPGVDYQTYKANAKQLLEDKMRIQRENPNAQQEREESRVGFSKRSQQQALQTKALQQQTLIDQIVDEDRRIRAGQAMAEQEQALERANAIDEEIQKRRQGQQEEQPMTITF